MIAPLVEIRNASRSYSLRRGMLSRPVAVRAVDDVSLSIMKGTTLGVVGESGSGKSTTGRMALGLEKPDSGVVRFEGQPMPPVGQPEWRAQRARMQMIFQDPLGALDRRLCILDQVREPLDIHQVGPKSDRIAQALDSLRAVGLSEAQGRRYPHELSGGQRQRAVLARALATKPDFLVCDEPISALDVSIQAQVVNLLVDLQDALGLTILFISHDLRAVRHVSHRIAVMYLGRIVEEGDGDTLFADPIHPYTRALVSAAPTPGKSMAERIILKGDPPNPSARPSGCAFHPRCPIAIDRCRHESPDLITTKPGRLTACHLAVRAT